VLGQVDISGRRRLLLFAMLISGQNIIRWQKLPSFRFPPTNERPTFRAQVRRDPFQDRTADD
jgi:hypothetical protein